MKDSEVIAQLEAIEEEQRALDARRMAVPDNRNRQWESVATRPVE